MKKTLRYYALGFLGLLIAAQTYAAEPETNVFVLQPMVLNLNQQQSLGKDTPFTDMVFDPQGALWVTGAKAVWRWSADRKLLNKISLIPAADETRLEKLAVIENGIVAASNRELFQVLLKTKQLSRFPHPKAGKGKTFGLTAHANGLAWLHQSGMVLYGTKKKKNKHFFFKEIEQASSGWYDFEENTLWAVRGGTVYAINTSVKDGEVRIVHQAKDAFMDLTAKGEYVYAHTNFAVLRFDRRTHELGQVIPVEPPKKLLAFNIMEEGHSYLFNDALFERYDVKKQKKQQARVALATGDQVLALRTSTKYMSILTQGGFHFYSKGPDLNLATKQ